MFPAPRQSSWGLIGLVGAIVLVVVGLKHWPRQESASPPAQTAPPRLNKIARPRGIFAPASPSSGTGEVQRTGASAAPEANTLLAPARDLLQGRVVAPDGAPIHGATLSLRSRSATSDAAGRFEITKASGRLRIAHPDYFPREVDADGAETMSLVLIPGVRVRGRVTSRDGRAVAGAAIQFGTGETPPQVSSDVHGEFSSQLLLPGPVCVLVSHADYQPQSRVIACRGPLERWDVIVEAGEPLVVLATDETGLQVAGAEVWLSVGSTRGAAGVSEWRFLGRTDDLGRIASRRPPREPASVRLSLAGFRDETADVPAGGEVRVRLRPVPAWRGHAVERRTGLPVRITTLRLEAKQEDRFVESPHRGILFESLEPGQFVVGLPPQAGTYRLYVRSQGTENSVQDLQGESEPVVFDGVTAPAHWIVRLEERLELRGVVLGPNGPLDGAGVELLADAPPEAIMGKLDDGPQRRWEVAGVKVPAPLRKLRESKSSERGRFLFAGLSHGTHRLRVRLDGFAEYLSAPFVVPWEGDFVAQLRRPARLSGTLYANGGRPESGVPILLIYEEDWSRLTRTDEVGHFAFLQLGPGSGYRLVVGSAQASGIGAGHLARTLSIEEGVDVTYNLYHEDPDGGSLAEGRHNTSSDTAPARIQPAVAREDDLVLAPSPVVSDDEAGSPVPALEGAAEPTADAAVDEPEPTPPAVESPPAPARLELELFDLVTRQPLAQELEVEVTRVQGGRTWRGRVASGLASVDGLTSGKHRVRIRSHGLLLAEQDLEVQGDTHKSLPLEEPHWVEVPLQTEDGEPFCGRATIALRSGGREILRRVETIDATLRVPTPGPGEYELTVDGDELFSRLRVRVTREVEAVRREQP